jgi:hypothetical protein
MQTSSGLQSSVVWQPGAQTAAAMLQIAPTAQWESEAQVPFERQVERAMSQNIVGGQSALLPHASSDWQKPRELQNCAGPHWVSSVQMHRPDAMSQVSPAGHALSMAQAQPPSGVLMKPAGQQPTPTQTQAWLMALYLWPLGQQLSSAQVQPICVASKR